ncbi:MAG TPA: c-type cytochrome [Vicinamibacterales bacterium]|nr:c-type cytochrome [Vicinamibacterales bacterium]
MFIVLILALATAASAQPAAPAGATRPNLKVLQALPEAQLFPLMNVLAASLGVSCDYCHVREKPDLTRTPFNMGGWIWDRDDKPAKNTARDMMRMVIELNAKNFRGEPRITCHTCHRGATHTEPLPVLPPRAETNTTPEPPPLPSVDRLWTTYVNAVGLSESAARGAVVFSGWDQRPEGRYGKVEIVLSGNDRYRATVSTADGPVSQGLDGDGGWMTATGRVQRLSADNLARLRRIAARYRPVRERPANLQVVGIDRLDDGDTYVATARIDAITTQALYFNVVSGLLRREVITTDTLLVPLQEQVDYGDYRSVNGIKFPFRVVTSNPAPYDTVTRNFNEIRLNVPVDVTTFRPPSQ